MIQCGLIGLVLVLAAGQASAGGDIHRCPDEAGTVQFQDQPCADGGGSVLRADDEGGEPNEEAVRDWLETLRPPDPPRAARPLIPRSSGIVVQVPQVTLVPRPDSPTLLRSCSALFFDCTNGADAYTDRCIAELPACSGRARYGCCHAAYNDRYQRLRSAGARRQTAVRAALLGSPHEGDR